MKKELSESNQPYRPRAISNPHTNSNHNKNGERRQDDEKYMFKCNKYKTNGNIHAYKSDTMFVLMHGSMIFVSERDVLLLNLYQLQAYETRANKLSTERYATSNSHSDIKNRVVANTSKHIGQKPSETVARIAMKIETVSGG